MFGSQDVSRSSCCLVTGSFPCVNESSKGRTFKVNCNSNNSSRIVKIKRGRQKMTKEAQFVTSFSKRGKLEFGATSARGPSTRNCRFRRYGCGGHN